MIEILILYILKKYDCTIYKIVKLIDEIFFAYAKTSTGSVNPALKRLENLSCVTYKSIMTDGGMLSKMYSITSSGEKHLNALLLNYVSQNPSHILNEAKMLLYCSDILMGSDLIEFKNNLRNSLELFQIKLERGLGDEYSQRNEIQKRTIEITLDETKELIKLL